MKCESTKVDLYIVQKVKTLHRKQNKHFILNILPLPKTQYYKCRRSPLESVS